MLIAIVDCKEHTQAREQMPKLTLRVNRQTHAIECAANALLVEVLRDTLHLTGTHVGCDTSQCGACTVHVDGSSVKACTMLAAEAEGHAITTIEGVANGDTLHPMQAAFQEHHGLQCGFCTPGMVMSAIDLCARKQAPSERDVRTWLEGNLCRCTGYHNIVKSVIAGAEGMQEAGKP
jgi:aerobic carbon-monoxide dehydrogenase small subunit